jgi:hypothetical protein
MKIRKQKCIRKYIIGEIFNGLYIIANNMHGIECIVTHLFRITHSFA